MEIVARGVRNTVGFDWHPVTKELWFTDNGRDWAGDAGPEDELNRIPKDMEGANFGFPYCHANGHSRSGHQAAQSLRRRDPAGRAHRTACRRPRHQVLHRRHVSRRSIRTSPSSPGTARGTGRQKFGYDVVLARIRGGKATIEPFMTGLLDDGEERVLRPALLRASR